MRLPSSFGNNVKLGNLNIFKIVKDIKLPSFFDNDVKLQQFDISKIVKNMKLSKSFSNNVNIEHPNIKNTGYCRKKCLGQGGSTCHKEIERPHATMASPAQCQDSRIVARRACMW